MNKSNLIGAGLMAGVFTLSSLFLTSCEKDATTENAELSSTVASALSSKSVQLPISSISASAEQSANPVTNAYDNDSSSRWSGQGRSVTFDIDLGSLNKVDYIKIAYYKGDIRKAYFDYQYSADGSSWTSAKSKTSSGSTSSLEIFDLANNDAARYIRLICKGTETGSWNSILDVEVYGTPSEETTETSTPSSGYVSIPATIQAEDYVSMVGIQTQSTSDAGGGENVGWIDAGDELTYQINVPSSGTYNMDFRVASNRTGSYFDIYQGNSKVGSINDTRVEGWQNFATVSTSVNLSAGNQTLKLVATTRGWNINWLAINNSTNTNNGGTTTTGTTSSHPTGSNPWDFFHNCDQWKITWIDGSEQKQLCTQDEVNGQYEVDGEALVFTVDLNGNLGTTSDKTKYSRSELREREEDGGSDIYWTTTGDHAMYIDEAITQKPNGKDHVVAGQIHGNKDDGIDDSMVVRLEGDHLFISFNGGNLREDVTIKRGYNLGDRFEVIFRIVNGRHYCYYSEDGNLKTAYNNGNANGYLISDGGSTTLLNLNYDQTYFKVGNYCQSNEEKETEEGTWGSSDNKCEVRVYGFDVNHEGGDFR